MAEKSPEVAYEEAISGLTEKYDKLKKLTAAITRRHAEAQEKVAQTAQSMAKIEADLNLAVDADRDEEALKLLQLKNQAEERLNELKEQLAVAENDMNDAKASLKELEKTIRKLKDERHHMVAKLTAAQIKAQLQGFGNDPSDVALRNVRNHINDTLIEANLNDELAQNDIDRQLRSLRRDEKEAAAKVKLEEFKKNRNKGSKREL